MSVKKRKDGNSPFYHFEFELRTGRGKERKRFRGSTRCASEREAIAFERAEKERCRLELAEALKREAAPDTVDDVFGRYWAAYGHKLAWAYTVERHMRDMLEFFGAAKPFADIGNADVAAMLEHYAAQTTRRGRSNSSRLARPVSQSTINRRLAVFKRIYNIARVKWELHVKSVDFKEHRGKEAKARVRHITRDQADILIRWLPRNIMLMAAWSFVTGCRRNETQTLSWDRVNFETQQAEVFTKGGGTRFVVLNPAALHILSQCDPQRELVFDATNLRRAWSGACKKAGLNDFRWHDIRHCFATWVGGMGADIAVIQQLLGHSDVRVTEKYRHVIKAEVQRAVADMPMLIHGPVVPFKKREA